MRATRPQEQHASIVGMQGYSRSSTVTAEALHPAGGAAVGYFRKRQYDVYVLNPAGHSRVAVNLGRPVFGLVDAMLKPYGHGNDAMRVIVVGAV